MAPPQWAYRTENLVKCGSFEKIHEILLCSICRGIFRDPVSLYRCKHVFCETCIEDWLENNNECPVCLQRASSVSIRPMHPIFRNLIMKLVSECRNEALGCKAQIPIEGCEDHMKKCGYESVLCLNKPCQVRLLRKDIEDHETTHCPRRFTNRQNSSFGSSRPENPNSQLRLKSPRNIIHTSGDSVPSSSESDRSESNFRKWMKYIWNLVQVLHPMQMIICLFTFFFMFPGAREAAVNVLMILKDFFLTY